MVHYWVGNNYWVQSCVVFTEWAQFRMVLRLFRAAYLASLRENLMGVEKFISFAHFFLTETCPKTSTSLSAGEILSSSPSPSSPPPSPPKRVFRLASWPLFEASNSMARITRSVRATASSILALISGILCQAEESLVFRSAGSASTTFTLLALGGPAASFSLPISSSAAAAAVVVAVAFSWGLISALGLTLVRCLSSCSRIFCGTTLRHSSPTC